MVCVCVCVTGEGVWSLVTKLTDEACDLFKTMPTVTVCVCSFLP